MPGVPKEFFAVTPTSVAAAEPRGAMSTSMAGSKCFREMAQVARGIPRGGEGNSDHISTRKSVFTAFAVPPAVIRVAVRNRVSRA